MTNTEKVWDYLDKAQIFYVTTVDGDQPKCRPFSFKMMANGKIYFGVGTFKDCYRQLENNPKSKSSQATARALSAITARLSLTTTRRCSGRPARRPTTSRKCTTKKPAEKLRMFCLGRGDRRAPQSGGNSGIAGHVMPNKMAPGHKVPEAIF
jgi:hypothetical protein